MNIRHPAINALVLIVALALIIFGVSMYARTQSTEVATALVILGASLVGAAGFLGGWKNFTEFVAKFLGRNETSDTLSREQETSSQASATSRGVAVSRDLTGTTITGDIHGNVIIGSSPPSPEPPTIAPSHYPTITPNLVHPYALQANFTGRAQERAELTAWLTDDAHPICALVAMGGMGKSALAWFWLTKDVLPSPVVTGEGSGMGVMWWSFYEGEASFAKFVDEALKYLSGHEIDAARLPTTYDRAQELRKELQSKRVLFVLDGFERQLRAYARLDAAYQRDDATESSREARACVEPDAARLLKDIAAGTTRAKVLITTRLPVSDLEDRAGDPLAGVLHRELKELARDDASAFMRAQGVTQGTPAEIATVCEAYGNHPLSLRLLSGLIARDTRTPGDIAAAPRHDARTRADLVQRQHHVLEQSYNALPDKERTLLSRLAAFRSAMTYDALAIFNEFGDEAKFDVALKDLQARGLLQRDTARNRYDLHPIVRHYCYDRLTDKTGVHTRLRDYFANIPMPDEDKVKSIEDLAPVIELYHHTVRARRYDEAWELYDSHLRSPLYYRLGKYPEDIELLEDLSADNVFPYLRNLRTQTWILTYLAMDYERTGQLQKALARNNQALALNKTKSNLGDWGACLVEKASACRHLGQLKDAKESIAEGVAIFDKLGDVNWRGISHRNYGHILIVCGEIDEATRELGIAEQGYRTFGEQGFLHGLSRTYIYCSMLSEQSGSIQLAVEYAQKAHDLATRGSFVREAAMAQCRLGNILFKSGSLIEADNKFRKVLLECRRMDLLDLEPDALLGLALVRHKRNDPMEASKLTFEALAIADRCEYRLKQAEIHNFLARWWMDRAESSKQEAEGSKSSSVSEALAEAKKHAEIAKERAWCDGPPHCYKPALDEAERMLKEIQGRNLGD